MKPILVPCRACGGSGQQELVSSLRWALELLRGPPLTAGEMRQLALEHPEMGPVPSVQAFCNRLDDLRKLGLVTRWKYGREWKYGLGRRLSSYTNRIGKQRRTP